MISEIIKNFSFFITFQEGRIFKKDFQRHQKTSSARSDASYFIHAYIYTVLKEIPSAAQTIFFCYAFLILQSESEDQHTIDVAEILNFFFI